MSNLNKIIELSNKINSNITNLNNTSLIEIDICIEKIRDLYQEINKFRDNFNKTDNEEIDVLLQKTQKVDIPIKSKLLTPELPEIKKDVLKPKTRNKIIIEPVIKESYEVEEVKSIKEPTQPKEELINITPTPQTEPATIEPIISNIIKKPAELLKEKINSKTLGEKLGENKTLLYDKLEEKQNPLERAKNLQLSPVLDVNKAISIGDRFMFVKDFFNGDTIKFNEVLTDINNMTDFETAYNHLLNNFNIDTDSESAKLFLNSIARKFL